MGIYLEWMAAIPQQFICIVIQQKTSKVAIRQTSIRSSEIYPRFPTNLALELLFRSSIDNFCCFLADSNNNIDRCA